MNTNFLVVMMIAGAACAAPIWNTAADLTGSRTGPSELVAGGNYTTNTVVSWQIGKDPIQTNLWRYTYTFSNFPNPGISHFSLEFSNSCTQANSQTEPCFLHNYTQPMGIFKQQPDGGGNSNPGFPSGSSFWGVKFDFGTEAPATYTFLSDRAPVWGSFYIKGGNTSYLYNRGLEFVDSGGNFTSENPLHFIARPDTVRIPPEENPVPEPGTYALIGAALLTLGILRKR